MLNPLPKALPTLLAALSLALAAAPRANAQDPNDATIYEVQGGAFSVFTFVSCDSVIVTAIAADGFWVEEPGGGALSGIYVNAVSGNPPPLNRGSLVTVGGLYRETSGNSEINISTGVGGFTNVINQTGTPPAAEPLDVGAVNTGSPTGEDWEGVLVILDSVLVVDTTAASDWLVIENDGEAPGETLLVDNLMAYDEPAIGTAITTLTGVMQYIGNSDFAIEPRDNFDIISPDPIAPAAIIDLAAATGTFQGEIDLSWTATGDDGGTGQAFEYTVRVNTVPITDFNWDTSSDVPGEPTPAPSGTPESMTVSGLFPGDTFYFAIKARDEAANESPISNSPSAAASQSAPAGTALRVCSYNLLDYDDFFAVRDTAFQRVLDNIEDIDVLAVQEMQNQSAMNLFMSNVLEVIEPGQWEQARFYDDPSSSFNQAMFYRPTSVAVVDSGVVANSPRDIAYYTVRPLAYQSDAAELTIFITHFKAGSSGADQTTRNLEAQRLRDAMNTFPAGSHMLVVGDFNMGSSGEAAYQEMIGSEPINTGRVQDPIDSPGSWSGSGTFAPIHTQSSRSTSPNPNDNGTNGGLDDRFDQILATYNLDDDEGLDHIDSSYSAFGNDGLHLNKNIYASPTIPEGLGVAYALHRASDHLPVFVDFQVPPIASVSTALDFGTAVVGATAEQTLTVLNLAAPPADELDYTLSAPSGFAAPGGAFQEEAGGSPNLHTITMETGATGVKGGNLSVDTDDVDNPTRSVSLSGTVVDHAVPSLAGASQVLATLVDFGTELEGGFSDQSVDAHNFGYNSLQALLNVYAADITGGAGRFSIVGGFSPLDVGATPATFTLNFDDALATRAADTTYTATLTFSTRDDEEVVGGIDLSDLTVSLEATVIGSPSAVAGEIRYVNRLFPSTPNPFARGTQIRFELARSGPVSLSVFDTQGRRVKTLVSERLERGRYVEAWDGSNGEGRTVAAGVYFYRLDTPGFNETRPMIRLR